jgi:hypothetical protein
MKVILLSLCYFHYRKEVIIENNFYWLLVGVAGTGVRFT